MCKIYTAFAYTLADVSRSAIRHALKTDKDAKLHLRMRELAEQHRRYGAPCLYMLFKREGLVVNHKRTERIYLEEKLSLRLKVIKKRPSFLRVVLQEPIHGDELWSMNFISDSFLDVRRIRILSMMYLWDRSSPAIEIDFSLPDQRIVRPQEDLQLKGRMPKLLRVDNGGIYMQSFGYLGV